MRIKGDQGESRGVKGGQGESEGVNRSPWGSKSRGVKGIPWGAIRDKQS